MKGKAKIRSEPARTNGANARVVDRHNEVIGRTARGGAGPGGDHLEIELAPALHRLFEAGDEPIEVPADWVAGVRRDEIRLSVGLQDPALREAVHAFDS